MENIKIMNIPYQNIFIIAQNSPSMSDFGTFMNLSLLKELSPLIVALAGAYLAYRFALKQIAAKKEHEVHADLYEKLIEYALSADMLSLDDDSTFKERKAKNKTSREKVYNLYLKYSIYFSEEFDKLCHSYLQNILAYCNYYLVPKENRNINEFENICKIKVKYINELIILDTKINFNNEIKRQIKKDLGLKNQQNWTFWKKQLLSKIDKK